jgi:uncharacterized protein YdaU (DUF1376 family)
MKYPFMPLFLGDLCADTLHLSAQEFGAYVLLFCHAWKHNGTVVVKDAQRIARVDNRQWGKVRAKLAVFFEPQDALGGSATEAVHPRVVKELAMAAEISNKRKGAAEQMHAKRRANASSLHMHPPSPSHLKNTNGSKNGPSRQASATKLDLGPSPDQGNEYRSPPAAKSDNTLERIPERPLRQVDQSKWTSNKPVTELTKADLESQYAAEKKALEAALAKSTYERTPAEIELIRRHGR